MVKMRNLAWGIAAIPLIVLPVARADGIVAGSFSYKLHATVPLVAAEKSSAYFQRLPDSKGLYGAAFTQQAGEPADMSVLAGFKVSGSEAVLEGLEIPEETVTELPPGPIFAIGEVQPCTHAQFLNTVSESAGGCPVESQVGVASVVFGGALSNRTYPLYKLVAAPGHLATLGFPYELLSQSVGVRVNADLRSGDGYGLTLSSSQIGLNKFVPGPFLTIWGVPAAPAHDSERWNPEAQGWGDSLGGPQVPLVANATDCNAGTQEARERLRYWSVPERWLPEDPEDPSFRSFAPAPDGCDRLEFAPQGEVSPDEGRGGAPAGIDLRLELPRASQPGLLATPPLEGAVLTLPEGMSVNPAAADGLAGCTPEQVGLESDAGDRSAPPHFSPTKADCPAAAAVGEGTVDTPLVDTPLTGKIYAATPYRNPFGSLLALYVVLPGPGFTAKLAVEVEAEPGSGRLAASLAALPPLPVDSVRLDLAAGPRAPLAPPPGCGDGEIELSLTPWSAPQSGPPARIASRYSYADAAGEGCASAGRPHFALQAGSTVPAAGRWSPFVLRLRGDEPGAFTVNLPAGLSARVRGAGRCGEAEIERAEARSEPGGGQAERQDPSCPASSRVGSLLVGAGPGPAPLAVGGDAYLAGPYRGAPFSLVTVTPALAGGTAGNPLFDLGTVVDRVALEVNRRDGAISAEVGAPPRAIDGVPLRISEIRLVLDRPGFVRNPTRCTKMAITAVGEGPGENPIAPSSDFRVSGCRNLSFRPDLRIAPLRGRRAPGSRPAVRAVLRMRRGEAAIAAARLTLPGSVRLDRLDSGCEAVAVGPGACPRATIHGHATAWSGLLGRRLSGPVYLRSRAGAPPELVLALGGGPELEIPARIRRRRGRAQLEFSRLPDLQLTRLVVGLWGGRRGLLVSSRAACGSRGEATSRLLSGAGAVRLGRTPFGVSCSPARGRSRASRQIAKRTEG
jgi:hypothetical protein